MAVDKKEFLAKLKKYDVGDDFSKKSVKMIERLFDKGIDPKSQKAGMDFVLKIYKNQADFKKSTDRIKESLKKVSATGKVKPAKRSLFEKR